jgi:hypothetical protein
MPALAADGGYGALSFGAMGQSPAQWMT